MKTKHNIIIIEDIELLKIFPQRELQAQGMLLVYSPKIRTFHSGK